MSSWYVYVLSCADDTFYTGITTDVSRRISEHENGSGAKYTKGRGPFTLHYKEKHSDRSSASKREYAIKLLSKQQKQALSSK